VQQLIAGNKHYGIYHYSNEGVISWFDFAVAINNLAGFTCNVLPISTSDYPTPAKRPAYSVLDKSNLVADFSIQLIDWKISLEKCIQQLKS
jgi:dTDP-4-dehydrorhamnose reductase